MTVGPAVVGSCSADPGSGDAPRRGGSWWRMGLAGSAAGLPRRVLRLAGRRHHRAGPAPRRALGPLRPRRRRHRPRPPPGRLVHRLAGRALHRADRARRPAGGGPVRPLPLRRRSGSCGPPCWCRSCCPPSSSGWLSSGCSAPAAPSASTSPGRSGRSSSPTSSSTTPSWCAPSAATWSTLDPRVEDAARTLGAPPWRVFREVTWPLLRPCVAAAASIVFLFTFTSFGVVLSSAGSAHRTLEVEIYDQTARFLHLDVAAGLAIVQLVGVVAGARLVQPDPAAPSRSLDRQRRAAEIERPARGWRARSFVGGQPGVPGGAVRGCPSRCSSPGRSRTARRLGAHLLPGPRHRPGGAPRCSCRPSRPSPTR